MGNVSFVKTSVPTETPVPGVVVESVNTACPAPADAVPSTSLVKAPPAVPAPVPFFDDRNINFKDIIVPRLNVVQKVGDLAQIFPPGVILLNQSTVIHVPAKLAVPPAVGEPGSGPLVLIPIGCRPLQFAEKVQGGGRGLFVNTEAEVAAANGTLDYKEWKASKGTANPKRRFEEYATFLFLVRRPATLLPDEEHQLFTHNIDGEYYTLAVMGLKGTWFTGFAKRLFTERKIGFLKEGGYASFNWNLTTFSKPFANDEGGTNYAIVPVLSNGTKNKPSVLEFIKDGLGFGV